MCVSVHACARVRVCVWEAETMDGPLDTLLLLGLCFVLEIDNLFRPARVLQKHFKQNKCSKYKWNIFIKQTHLWSVFFSQLLFTSNLSHIFYCTPNYGRFFCVFFLNHLRKRMWQINIYHLECFFLSLNPLLIKPAIYQIYTKHRLLQYSYPLCRYVLLIQDDEMENWFLKIVKVCFQSCMFCFFPSALWYVSIWSQRDICPETLTVTVLTLREYQPGRFHWTTQHGSNGTKWK